MPDFAVRTAFTATDKISPAFKKMGRQADVFGSKGSRAMAKMQRATSGLMTSMKGLLPIFGIAVIGRYANKAIELASALTEVQNVVDTTFGTDAKQINKWSKTAIVQFGLSELQAKKYTGTLGAMMKGSGVATDKLAEMSTGLSALAGDYASFFDLPIDEAFEKIQSGLAGMTMPLRSIGKDLSVAALQEYALAQGMNKKVSAMNQAEKMMLRYNYLLSISKDQMGDFNKTLATSYANQKRVLGVQFDQFLANIMVKILPKLIELFKRMNKVLAKIDTEKIARGLELVVDLLPWLIKGFIAYKVALLAVVVAQKAYIAINMIQSLIELRHLIKGAIVRTTAWAAIQKVLNFVMAANPIGLVIVAVAALVAGIILLVKNWDAVKASLGNTVWGKSLLTILQVIEELIRRIGEGAKAISDLFSGDTGAAKKFAMTLGPSGAFAKAKAAAEREKNAPNQAKVQSNVRLDGEININGAPQGSTASSKTRGSSRPINMNLVGVNP